MERDLKKKLKGVKWRKHTHITIHQIQWRAGDNGPQNSAEVYFNSNHKAVKSEKKYLMKLYT